MAELAMAANLARSHEARGMPVQESPAALDAGFAEMAEDIFHHDHGGIHHQAEIDRADRQKVGGFAAQRHHDDGEEQAQTESWWPR
jgi:hypothetical protein